MNDRRTGGTSNRERGMQGQSGFKAHDGCPDQRFGVSGDVGGCGSANLVATTLADSTSREASHTNTGSANHYDSDRELQVLYASVTLLAVDKPAGIIVHGDGTGAVTLTDRVRSAIEAGSIDGVNPQCASDLQALQRLDRDTSGIVLFSICKRTQGRYDYMIAEHACTKRYCAIACGRIPWTDRMLIGPIGRDRHDARRMRVSRTGKSARTVVHVLNERRVSGQWLSLLDITIETGRKHQIRVHLAHEGYPLLGDALYGRTDPRGLMLHARELSFVDPISAESVRIISPTPARISTLFP